MEWYYAVGDKQMGPVAEDEFKKLAADGTIRPDTLVWNADMDGWKAYGDATSVDSSGPGTEASTGTSALAASIDTSEGTVVCGECGKLFKSNEVCKTDAGYVCGDCEPEFTQRQSEAGGGGDLNEEELLNTDYEVDISDRLGASWNTFQKNMGIMIGATVLVYICIMAANMIPYLSMILGMVLSGPLMAGLWKFYVEINRGREGTINDAFSGFGPSFWQLVLVNIVTSVITMLCMLPMILTLIGLFGAAFVSGAYQGNVDSIPTEFGAVGAFLLVGTLLFGIGAVFFLTTVWLYALPLVIDKGLAFWPALELSRKMVLKHFWGTLGLYIVCGLLTGIGAMMCGVGLLFTGPIAFGAIVWQYDRIFGRLRPESYE